MLKFGTDNCYVFHTGLIKLGLDCMLPFFFNPAIKQTNNNKKKKAETATSVLYIYCGRLHVKWGEKSKWLNTLIWQSNFVAKIVSFGPG